MARMHQMCCRGRRAVRLPSAPLGRSLAGLGDGCRFRRLGVSGVMQDALSTDEGILELLSKHFEVIPGRVPYTYHHDYVRGQVDAAHSRSEVAGALTKYAEEFTPEARRGQLFLGCLAYLCTHQPSRWAAALMAGPEIVLAVSTAAAMIAQSRAPDFVAWFKKNREAVQCVRQETS